jgi:hypothetical protein
MWDADNIDLPGAVEVPDRHRVDGPRRGRGADGDA